MAKNLVGMIAWILVIVGGINWGLYAFDFNLVNLLFGWSSIVEMIVYILVALSALYLIFNKNK